MPRFYSVVAVVPLHRLRCAAMVLRVSPSCVIATASKARSFSVSWQAMALASTVMDAVSSQAFREPHLCVILCTRRRRCAVHEEEAA